MLLLGCALALVLVLAFAVISSGHDVSNAIAIPVRHRALTPRTALGLGSALNALGAVLAAAMLPWDNGFLASALPYREPAVLLLVLCCALAASIGWALLTWRWGLPASMGAALISALIGAGLGARLTGLIHQPPPITSSVIGLVVLVLLAPVVAFALGWLLVVPAVRTASRFEAAQVTTAARVAMVIGSSAGNLSHGIVHGQRMLILLAAVPLAAGLTSRQDLGAWWMTTAAALALAAGSLLGGWPIARTISSRMVRPDALRGATAQAVASALILPAALGSELQLSTSQTTASAVLGAGENQRFRSTHLRVVSRVLACWLLTVPVCGLTAGILVTATSPLLG